MKELTNKFLEIEKKLSIEKGEFELFALFLHENSSGKWDLVVSSQWARSDKKQSIGLIVNKIDEYLTDSEKLNLSRIIILDKDDAALNAILSSINVEHGTTEIANSLFFGLMIKHAFIITSKRVNDSV